MYQVDNPNRFRTSQFEYSGMQGNEPYPLMGPGAPSSRSSNYADYYPYPQVDSSQARVPYPGSRNYSGEFTTANNSTYPDYPQESFEDDYSTVVPSLAPVSRRRDANALGISVPLPHSKPSHYTPSTASTSNSESWPSTMKEAQPSSPPPKKKSRREKPKIALAPDQPPTTQGKPRARVYVACLQCRTRKIRCDGAKPVCHNCGKRSGGTASDCNYDPVPRRRGPDKTPGARQRMARELRQEMESNGSIRRRRRRLDSSELSGFPDAASTSQFGLLSGSSDEALTMQRLNGSLSPASSSDYNISPSYMAPPISLASPIQDSQFLAGCPCHGLVQCPNSQPYVSARTQSLPPSNELSESGPTSGYEQFGHITNAVSRRRVHSLDSNSEDSDDVMDIIRPPSITFSRKNWFDSLIFRYAELDTGYTPVTLTRSDREAISRSITEDLRHLFHNSNYWFSFFHAPSFFRSFYDPVRRERMQPSLVLAALALSTFWQSSEIGKGRSGRDRALRLQEEALSALEGALSAGAADETLAQAAWILALFEVCVHPEHSTTRSVSAITMLDKVISYLTLTVLDADDPDTSFFSKGQVPGIMDSSSPTLTAAWSSATTNPDTYFSHMDQPSSYSPSPSDSAHEGCSCNRLTLGHHSPSSLEHTPMWATTPMWDPEWSEGEIKKESSRRLVWAAISLAAGHVSYASANDWHIPSLFIADPANFALLFSGESVCRSPSLSASSPKDTVWALYDRSFLLWHTCVRVRADTSMSDVAKGQFAVKAWLEADAIERALNKHKCGIEKAYVYQGREYLFNTRMCISFEFQRYVPLVNSNVSGMFHRTKAEEWLVHQIAVAKRYMHGLHTITGNSNNMLSRRPFFILWFMSQILRALSLWQCDNTLIIALDVCKAFLPAVDYLSAIWPCTEQRQRYLRLRNRLDIACQAADIPLAPPPNFSLPDPSSSV